MTDPSPEPGDVYVAQAAAKEAERRFAVMGVKTEVAVEVRVRVWTHVAYDHAALEPIFEAEARLMDDFPNVPFSFRCKFNREAK